MIPDACNHLTMSRRPVLTERMDRSLRVWVRLAARGPKPGQQAGERS